MRVSSCQGSSQFATLPVAFDESLRWTSSVRQVVPNIYIYIYIYIYLGCAYLYLYIYIYIYVLLVSLPLRAGAAAAASAREGAHRGAQLVALHGRRHPTGARGAARRISSGSGGPGLAGARVLLQGARLHEGAASEVHK